MMPEEWPIAASAAEFDTPARGAGGDRLSTVRVDFFLAPAQRLTEQERALMTAMLHCLVGDIADEIHARLPLGWGAANDERNAALLDRLTTARLLDEPRLIALLLRRADEDRIGTGARARSGRREARALQGLVSHENSAVSAAAMALILARGRRRDRFGQCLLDFDDLAALTAEILVNAIAAGLRHDFAATHGAALADQALVAATSEVLARREPQRSVDVLTATLARLLDEIGSLNDELIVAAANEGEIGFVAQALARRGGIGGGSSMDELLSGSGKRIMRLLRAAGSSRALAAGLLAGIGDLLGIEDPGEAIDSFDRITADQADAARASLSADSTYRTALAALENIRG
jgi:uncharacterized protein DUF2336